jgi:hypothetical protein
LFDILYTPYPYRVYGYLTIVEEAAYMRLAAEYNEPEECNNQITNRV